MAETAALENPTSSAPATAAEQPEEVEGADGDSSKIPVALDDPYKKAISYLEEHHIIQIFQVLTSGIVFDRPEDPIDYMIQQVETLQHEKKYQVRKPGDDEY